MQVNLTALECKMLWLVADLGLDRASLPTADLQSALTAIQKVYRAQLGKGA